MWFRGSRAVTKVLPSAAFAVLGLLVLMVSNGPAMSAAEPRGPRFGVKPHPGRVEHIHPGSHGEIVYHHDPRVFQGINRDEFRLDSKTVDAGQYWETGRFRGGPGALATVGLGGSLAAASSGYYEGISKPKYEYRRSEGFKNVYSGGVRSTHSVVALVAAFSLLPLLVTSRSYSS